MDSLEEFLYQYRVGRKDDCDEQLMYDAICALIEIVEKQESRINCLEAHVKCHEILPKR
jgi:hypothetical protein